MSFYFSTVTTREGAVEVTVPRSEAFAEKKSTYAPSKAPVFYNPAMTLTRHIAVLALQAFQRLASRQLTACEPMSGCGIRGLRLAKEVEGVEQVVINDINTQAYALAKFNVEKNKLKDRVHVSNKDVTSLLSFFAAPRKRFDYIDLDPFGSPMPYVDSVVQALKKGGFLALTATDLAPLCGVHPRACIRKYGGKPLRTEYSRELALRLVAGALTRAAAKHGMGTKITFSHSSAHYVRLYAQVDHGARKADSSLENLGYISHCFTCFHRHTSVGIFQYQENWCPECGHRMNVAGPLWIGKIVDEHFVVCMEREAKSRALKQKPTIKKLLDLAREEANAAITYYCIDRICDKLGLSVPPVKSIMMNLKREGCKVALTHFEPQGVKTDASARTVNQIILNSV